MIYNTTVHYGESRKLLRLDIPLDNSVNIFYKYYENADYSGYRVEEMIYAECAAVAIGDTPQLVKLWRDNSYQVVFGS